MPRGWETVNRKQREGGAAFPVHSSTESNMASRINYRELVTLNRPNKTPTLQAIMSPTSCPRNNVCIDHALVSSYQNILRDSQGRPLVTFSI